MATYVYFLHQFCKIPTMTSLLQPPFEDIQSAFVRYGIEVGSWEDVPQGVDQLAHKQGKEPLPDGELLFICSSVCNLANPP